MTQPAPSATWGGSPTTYAPCTRLRVPRSGEDYRPARVGELIDAASAEGRTLLDEAEAKESSSSYGIPVVPTRVARAWTRPLRRPRWASRSP